MSLWSILSPRLSPIYFPLEFHFGRDLRRSADLTPYGRGSLRLARTLSNSIRKTTSSGDSTMFLVRLFQCLISFYQVHSLYHIKSLLVQCPPIAPRLLHVVPVKKEPLFLFVATLLSTGTPWRGSLYWGENALHTAPVFALGVNHSALLLIFEHFLGPSPVFLYIFNFADQNWAQYSRISLSTSSRLIFLHINF